MRLMLDTSTRPTLAPRPYPGHRLAATAAHLRELVLDAGALTDAMAREFETLASLAADLVAFTYATRRQRPLPRRRHPRKTTGGRAHAGG